MSTGQVKKAFEVEGVPFDSFHANKGVYTIRRVFFYRFGGTAESYRNAVLRAIPQATIVDHGEVWKPFNGGASPSRSSHWFVKFSVANV